MKLIDILNEDKYTKDANNWVEFLKNKLDLENLKQEFGASLRTDMDYAEDYYNVLDRLSNTDIE